MKRVSDLKPEIPYMHRLKSTIKANNVDEKIRGERGSKFLSFEYSSEAFNSENIFREPDTIGITIYYPTKEATTHTITGFYPFNIDMKSLGLEINKLFEKLCSKIPQEIKTKELKRRNKN